MSVYVILISLVTGSQFAGKLTLTGADGVQGCDKVTPLIQLSELPELPRVCFSYMVHEVSLYQPNLVKNLHKLT